MLGHALQQIYPGAAVKGHELDITDGQEITKAIHAMEPEIVINAAAYTNVDGCEENPRTAYAVNGEALAAIAGACSDADAKLIHFSTDYVFDGTRTSYREDDTPHPLSIYGKSKLLGERNVMETMEDFRIIRTSWLFGKYGRNFVETMIRLSKEMTEVRVVNDQFGKPTYTMDLATKTREIARLSPGIYHISNEGICSWYEFARAIIPNAVPCSTEEFPRKAKRPAYSVLINTKTSAMRPWREALAVYLKERES